MRYIDADKLKKFLTERYKVCPINDDERHGRHCVIIEIEGFIDSLQQEQPEVDLDFQSFAKEMDSIFALPKDMTENTEENPLNWEHAIACHFYELGLKARKK